MTAAIGRAQPALARLPTRLLLSALLFSSTAAACILVEDHGPVGSVWNRTSASVVVSYRSPGGATAPWEVEVSSGEKVLADLPFQAFAKSGCLPGTLVAKDGDGVIAEVRGLCADATWEITEAAVGPDASAHPQET